MDTRSFKLLALGLLMTCELAARPKIDTVVMINGDRFTCEIKKVERGVLYALFDYVDGTVSISWAKVARVESTQPFIVHTQDGSIYRGTIHSPEAAGPSIVQIEPLEEAAAPPPVERARVVELVQTSQVVWHRFSGSLDSGLMFTKGNEATQYNLGADLRIRGEHWRLATDFLSNFSKSSGVTASTRNQTRVWARRLLSDKRKWYFAGGTEFLQSSQQDISLQTTLGGGVGRFVKDTNYARIAFTSGLAYQSTNYYSDTTRLSPPNAMAAMLNGDLHLFRFKKTGFDVTASVLPLLTQAGRVRTYINSAYKIQIIPNLWFKFSFYGNWDNRPPATLSGSDYGVSSSISYTFN